MGFNMVSSNHHELKVSMVSNNDKMGFTNPLPIDEMNKSVWNRGKKIWEILEPCILCRNERIPVGASKCKACVDMELINAILKYNE